MTHLNISYVSKEIMGLDLIPTAKLLLLLISSLPKGLFMNGEATASTLNISRSSIYRAKEDLEKKGFLVSKVNEFGKLAWFPRWDKIKSEYEKAVQKLRLIGKQNDLDLCFNTAQGQYNTFNSLSNIEIIRS